MTMACHHIGIFTEDPKRLIRYYTKGIGFVEGGTRILPPELTEAIFGLQDRCQLTKLTQDNAVIEIFSPLNLPLDRPSKKTAGYNHWALEVEDKEAYIQLLEERDVDVIKIDHEGRRLYFLSDPEGNLIEIHEANKK
jgi:catechol 2,3-dioxygenase-like lactoylglutathione lyase family enzyme